ncbi:hypothetical protein DFH09DRAFT_1147755 [Mycena vulgaris]|nr:hypothetical protein DFH09DRAFT_1147755 [Mycena vulgaris]
MLLDLPTEILQEIESQLERIDHKRLRAVCKDLRLAMDPLFFSSLVLDLHQLRLESGREFQETLVAGQTGWSLYAKTLTIIPGKKPEWHQLADPRGPKSEDANGHLLSSALGSMKNVQAVIWKVDDTCPAWEQKAICDVLDALPLTDLKLEIRCSGDALSIRGLPRIHKLEIQTAYWKPPPLVQQVSKAVAQSRTLTSLRLAGSNDWSEVWNILGDNSRMQLTDISTQTLTPELLTYLASYSGIEKLTIKYPDTRREAEHLGDALFETVIRRNTGSLVELSCAADYESRWSFGTHNVDTISLLQKLTCLEMSVNASEVLGVESPMSIVVLLLRTAALLPALRRLAIFPANLKINRGGRCEDPRGQNLGMINLTIADAVKSFSSPVASSAIVLVPQLWKGYSQRLVAAAGGESVVWEYGEIPRSDADWWLKRRVIPNERG